MVPEFPPKLDWLNSAPLRLGKVSGECIGFYSYVLCSFITFSWLKMIMVKASVLISASLLSTFLGLYFD